MLLAVQLLAALAVEGADEAPHRMASGHMQVDGSCWGSRPFASEDVGPKMNHVNLALSVILVPLQTCLNLDSLIHQGGKIWEVVSQKSKVNIWVKTFTEFLLPASISCNVFLSIAR